MSATKPVQRCSLVAAALVLAMVYVYVCIYIYTYYCIFVCIYTHIQLNGQHCLLPKRSKWRDRDVLHLLWWLAVDEFTANEAGFRIDGL